MNVDVVASDRENGLIADCLNGQVEAFGELIRPYQDRLFNVLYRILGSREDAAEALQDAFVRAFRGLRSFEAGASFYTWLYRVAINAAFSRRRKNRVRILNTEEFSTLRHSELAIDLQQPSESMEARERKELVQEALGRISPVHRSMLVLKDIEGLKYEELAEIFAVPVGTVRSRLHRARSELKRELQPYFDEGLI